MDCKTGKDRVNPRILKKRERQVFDENGIMLGMYCIKCDCFIPTSEIIKDKRYAYYTAPGRRKPRRAYYMYKCYCRKCWYKYHDAKTKIREEILKNNLPEVVNETIKIVTIMTKILK